MRQQTLLSFFLPILKPHKWSLILMFQAPIVTTFYPVIDSYAVKIVIDLLSQNNQIQFNNFYYPLALFVGGHILLDISWRIHNIASLKAQPFIRQEVLCRCYEYVSGHAYLFFQNNFPGSIVSKIKGVSDGLVDIISGLEYNVTSPVVNTIVAAIMLSLVNFNIFLIILGFSIFYIPINFYFYKRLGFLQQEMTNDYHKIIGFIGDTISNIISLLTFATRERESRLLRNYYKKNNIPLQRKWFKVDFYNSIFSSVLYWIVMTLIFIYIIYLRKMGRITIGDVTFIIGMSTMFTDNLWRSMTAIKDFSNKIADFNSSFSILRMPQQTLDKPDAKEISITKGELKFKDVAFTYTDSGAAIIRNLNLTIKPGERIGLIGSSGAGKSTLIALLLKRFPLSGGDIIIDGQNINDFTTDSICSQISLIPQDISLFHRSIRENIGYAKDNPTTEEIEEAAKKANIHDYIMSLPEGYETQVGDRGVKLSGGQRQRMAIARAMLKNNTILILDEATSALDTETEQQIQKSINSILETTRSTVIAIAHRLSTIRHMDRIIVMHKGEVVESGTFTDLMKQEGSRFKALWDHQVDGMVS